MTSSTGSKLQINYKLSNAYICNNEYCFKNIFIVVKNPKQKIIFRTPFLIQIYPFIVNSNGIYSNILRKEIRFKVSSSMKSNNIAILQEASIPKIIFAEEKQTFLPIEIIQANTEEQLIIQTIQQKIQKIKNLLDDYICSNLPNAFWDRKQHMVELSYEKVFVERNIPVKAHLIQINKELSEFCKKEIQSLLNKKLIRFSKSH